MIGDVGHYPASNKRLMYLMQFFCLPSILPRCMARRRRRSSHEKAVRLSVCPSVKHVDCDKTKEISAQIVIPYERTFILVFTKND